MVLCPLRAEWKSVLTEHGGPFAMETIDMATITGGIMRKLELFVVNLDINSEVLVIGILP